MCGIAGVINYTDINLSTMVNTLKHRGPDDQTIYTDEQIALLHTRLAIQDIKQGVQPFHYGSYTIIFNGEIYNHLRLRTHLSEFQFKTQSDTETLLYLFIKYGFKLFDLIDGMFAFCIYDKHKKQLVLARDRAGKKPIYYYKNADSFLFASELNAIKAVQQLSISEQAIHCYLRAGLIWRPHTPYRDVFELEAGSYLTIDVNTLNYTKHAYFDIVDYYEKSSHSGMNFAESVEQVEVKLAESIKDRIQASDVEVGVFLSGGIDSNLIAALAAKIKPNIKTFTVKFPGSYDESGLARLTANKYQTDHTELTITQQVNTDIEKILLAYGEPFMDSSAIPSYYVSKAARQHVKVVLGGDGADELFAGYRRYVPAAHSVSHYAKWLNPLLSILPKPHNKQSFYNYIYRLIAMMNKKGLDFYLSATSDVFEDIHPIADNAIITSLSQFVENTYAKKQLSPLKKMLYTDFCVLLFGDLLVKMDIASMANSLEVRSPFLSKSLLEFAPSLPDKYKIKRTKTKYILRKLAEKHLPQALVNQPKRGFEVPLKNWVNHELKERIHDALTSNCYASRFIQGDFIQQLLADKLEIGAEKRAKILWSLYCLEVWHRAQAA